MPGYCGICGKEYDEDGFEHMNICPGNKNGSVISGSLEDYQQQTGDYGLIQAPIDFDWNEAQDQLN